MGKDGADPADGSELLEERAPATPVDVSLFSSLQHSSRLRTSRRSSWMKPYRP